MRKRSWPNSSQSKLLAGAVIVGLAAGYLTGLWSDLAYWVDGLVGLLAASTLVPNWLLGLFAVCAVIVAGWLGAALRPSRDPRPSSSVTSEDSFFNIRWRWAYDRSGRIEKPTPHCLRCGSRLVVRQVGDDRGPEHYECRCEQCGHVACEIEGSVDEFEKRVLDRIHQVTSA